MPGAATLQLCLLVGVSLWVGTTPLPTYALGMELGQRPTKEPLPGGTESVPTSIPPSSTAVATKMVSNPTSSWSHSTLGLRSGADNIPGRRRGNEVVHVPIKASMIPVEQAAQEMDHSLTEAESYSPALGTNLSPGPVVSQASVLGSITANTEKAPVVEFDVTGGHRHHSPPVHEVAGDRVGQLVLQTSTNVALKEAGPVSSGSTHRPDLLSAFPLPALSPAEVYATVSRTTSTLQTDPAMIKSPVEARKQGGTSEHSPGHTDLPARVENEKWAEKILTKPPVALLHEAFLGESGTGTATELPSPLGTTTPSHGRPSSHMSAGCSGRQNSPKATPHSPEPSHVACLSAQDAVATTSGTSPMALPTLPAGDAVAGAQGGSVLQDGDGSILPKEIPLEEEKVAAVTVTVLAPEAKELTAAADLPSSTATKTPPSTLVPQQVGMIKRPAEATETSTGGSEPARATLIPLLATLTPATSISPPRSKLGVSKLESEEEPDEEDEGDKETEDSDEEDSQEDTAETPTPTPAPHTYSHVPYHLYSSSIWMQRHQGLVRSWVEKVRDKAGYVSGMLAPVGIGIAGALFILGALYSIKMMHRKRRGSFKHQRRKQRETNSRQDRVMLLADSSEDEF